MTGGYFISFMSGNSTRLGLGLVRGLGEALLAGGLIAAFIGGVVLGASLRRLLPSRPEFVIVSALAVALAVCGLLAHLHVGLAAALALAGAMGLENTIFAGAGEVRIGLTYMTGALVKVGKGVAAALFREAPFAWAPHAGLWLGLVCGAALGGLAFGRMGPSAIWLAALAATVLSSLSLVVVPQASADQ